MIRIFNCSSSSWICSVHLGKNRFLSRCCRNRLQYLNSNTIPGTKRIVSRSHTTVIMQTNGEESWTIERSNKICYWRFFLSFERCKIFVFVIFSCSSTQYFHRKLGEVRHRLSIKKRTHTLCVAKDSGIKCLISSINNSHYLSYWQQLVIYNIVVTIQQSLTSIWLRKNR